MDRAVFVVEPTDKLILLNPEKEIIEKGGLVFFGKIEEEIVGTFALLKVENDIFEIAKMAVTKNWQSHGIGKQMLERAIQLTKRHQAKKIILYTHTNLKAAIGLYHKFGFREIEINDFHNNRANIKMELIIK